MKTNPTLHSMQVETWAYNHALGSIRIPTKWRIDVKLTARGKSKRSVPRLVIFAKS